MDRVIALAHKRFGNAVGPMELREVRRSDLESNLEFAGFAIFQVTRRQQCMLVLLAI